MSTVRHTEVEAASLVRQAVLNTSSSIELFREAVSNSVDAGAAAISIVLESGGGDVWDVIIEDDGRGMGAAHMSAFFNAGQTVKDIAAKEIDTRKQYLAIGEKGLGSKTTFVAKRIVVESVRDGEYRVGIMDQPMAALDDGRLPEYSELVGPGPSEHERRFVGDHGTRVTLMGVRIPKFNGVEGTDAARVADRLMHYLRTLCATGTVKLRHAQKRHVLESVTNVTVAPTLTVVVTRASNTETRDAVSGYPVPSANPAPTNGPEKDGIALNSQLFCDVLDFGGSRTIVVDGVARTVHYDGTAIVAGEAVRNEMLAGELKAGWTHKSQMGVHLCKDFIPLRNDSQLSRQLLDPEYYYDFKVFVNSQAFRLNADRNVVTNLDSDDVSWILDEFRRDVWPKIFAKAKPYRDMKSAEDAALEAVRKATEASELKSAYGDATNLEPTVPDLLFVKEPRKEADTSHLFAMMVQNGRWAERLSPVAKFGQYIDASTDVLVETTEGKVLLVEIETSLRSLFRHRHPMDSYDLVVVWTLGGLDNGDSNAAPWGPKGENVNTTLVSTNSGWVLRWGIESRPVIVLSEVLREDTLDA